MDVTEILRMLERLIVVLFGGYSIHLGYRLFFSIPYSENSSGEFTLPSVKASIQKVGPGIFFAAFGCFVLITSLMQEIEKPFFRGSMQTSEVIAKPITADLFLAEISQVSWLRCNRILIENSSIEEMPKSFIIQSIDSSIAGVMDKIRKSLLKNEKEANKPNKIEIENKGLFVQLSSVNKNCPERIE